MVQVTVFEGVLEGEVVNNEYGGTFYSFKGVPYAAPPVGDLRFKAPQPLPPWNGVRGAKEHGPISYQFDLSTQAPPSGSEDCLYLNVYTPNINPQKPLPVMLYIHGGAFLCGSGNDDKYGPEFLVKENVILVTINYRVDALGFLCLDTEDIPGNAGMKDQVAALRWVKKNISNFGGDPDNVTIFGESAGAASVMFHLVSPMTKGLFKRAIAQSGSAVNPWAYHSEPRERAIAIAKTLGLNSEDDKELYEFFKSQPKESLIMLNAPITFTELVKETKDLQLGVVSEKKFGDNERFFYGDVINALSNNVHDGVEVMAGYCAHEGLLAIMNFAILEKIINQANNFLEIFVPNHIATNCSKSAQLEVGRQMKKFYYKNEDVSMSNLEQIVDFFSTTMFNYGIIQSQKLLAQKGFKTYTYKFTCKSERNMLAKIFIDKKIIGPNAVCHTDDLAYIFDVKVMKQKVDMQSKTFKMIENVVKLWTNFAKYGNPTPDGSLGVEWRPYSSRQQDYLDIGEELRAGTEPDKEQVDFWEDIFRQYLPQYLAESSS